VSKVELKDEGIWYFHIIQDQNLRAEWYLHKATVKLQNPKGWIQNSPMDPKGNSSENPGKNAFSYK